ncbi:hypothetical protein [Butyrivibrio sp. LB2008]|uniref:hypothetical protein n=1 Tax=Butyrivibrio sp. LB2008 TaxID=1408305 RepID=UPI0006874F93|nr:hypothetical protein [Butyrivibrio sp. LB2008]
MGNNENLNVDRDAGYDVIAEVNKLELKYGDEFNWGTDMDNAFFEKELIKELVISPNSNVKALARSYSDDDVLFLLDEEVYRIYHLTYSVGTPRYIEFADGKSAVEYIEKQFVEEYL